MPFDTNIGGSPVLNLNKIEHFSKVSKRPLLPPATSGKHFSKVSDTG